LGIFYNIKKNMLTFSRNTTKIILGVYGWLCEMYKICRILSGCKRKILIEKRRVSMKRRFSKALRKALAVSLTLSMVVSVPVVANAGDTTSSSSTTALPTPLYLYEFTDGSLASTGKITNGADAEIKGDGQVTEDGTFQNDVAGTESTRENYLKLPSDVLAQVQASGNNEMTVSFKVKGSGSDVNVYWSSLFTIQKVENDSNTWPCLSIYRRGGAYLNAWGIIDASATLADNTYMSDGEWHTITMTATEGTLNYYMDGVPYQTTSSDVAKKLFEDDMVEVATSVSLGGNQLFAWADPDVPAYFDDVAIYDVALSSSQISVMINGIDTSKLDEAIEKAQKLSALDYTSETYSTLESKLQEAQTAENRLEQDKVDALAIELTAAIDALVPADNGVGEGLIGSYNFNSNVTDLVSGEDAKQVVIETELVTNEEGEQVENSIGRVTTSTDSVFSYEGNDAVSLGEYGLKLPTTLNNVSDYTIALNVSVKTIKDFDCALYAIQPDGYWVTKREVLYATWGTGHQPAYNNAMESGDWNFAMTSSKVIDAATQYNIIVRKSGSYAEMFIDGVSVASTVNATSGALDNALNVLLGANSWGLSTMDVYDCEIYDRALSKTEITKLTNMDANEVYGEYLLDTVGAQKNESEATTMAFVTQISTKDFDKLTNGGRIVELGVYVKKGSTLTDSEIGDTTTKIDTAYVNPANLVNESLSSDYYAFRSIITSVADENQNITAVPFIIYEDSNGTHEVHGKAVTRKLADL
jgi:hypothetical protein